MIILFIQAKTSNKTFTACTCITLAVTWVCSNTMFSHPVVLLYPAGYLISEAKKSTLCYESRKIGAFAQLNFVTMFRGVLLHADTWRKETASRSSDAVAARDGSTSCTRRCKTPGPLVAAAVDWWTSSTVWTCF